MQALKKQSGLTLIELLIVVAILAILASVAVSSYRGYVVKAKLTELMSLSRTAQTHRGL